jgi:hypothetical protein
LFANVSQYDLELVLMKNFHEFVHEYLQKPEFTELMRRLGALGDGRQDQSNVPVNLIDFLPLNGASFPPPQNSIIRKMQVHCRKMSGRFPISISHLSCGRYCATHVFPILLASELHVSFLLTHSPFTARATACPTKSQQCKQREDVPHRG